MTGGQDDGATGPAPAPLGIVVVNYGPPGLLEEHVLRHDLSAVPAVLVVVDNFSTPGHRDDVERLCRERGLPLVALPVNAGFGAGANAGAARAVELGCDALLFLNPDAALDATTAAALHAEVVADRRTMVSPRVVHGDGRPWFAGADVSLRTGRTRRAGVLRGPELHPWLSGACLAVSAGLWAELGGFDESYFLYWEDVDLSVRCVRGGGRLLVRQDLEAVHAVGGTQGGGGKSPVYVRYNCRNRLLFARRHLSRARVLRWVVTSPVHAAEVLRRDGWRRALRSPRLVRAAVAGTVEGVVLACSPAAARP
ncbi:glycosyltransferase [Kineococcus sp. R8]|uniref:glycosyltransferase family 2 protein n=1 Tax=Kineococcus siccus TaxID=2696567 RepID=UPI0014134703|nr:glycosyltransferase [Kineococcus siccus]NAZ81403.1 glycosyltransferase [Kineococcus siccus]